MKNQNGENEMNTKVKWTALALCAALLTFTGKAWADANPANDSGSFIIRIQPNVDLGVTVDTSDAGWTDGGNLDLTADLNSTSILNTGVLLTVAGDFSNQELTLQGAANNSWSLDADEAPAEDQLRLYAMIGLNQNTAPAAGSISAAFGSLNLIGTSAVRAGQAQPDEAANDDTGKVYEFANAAGTQFQDVDGMAVGTTRRLWLRADTPPMTTSADQQTFTITVTAVTGTGL
jgi:hypothetical protein